MHCRLLRTPLTQKYLTVKTQSLIRKLQGHSVPIHANAEGRHAALFPRCRASTLFFIAGTMSRDVPILLPTTPEEAATNRRIVVLHGRPHRVELSARCRNDAEIIDLAQDDDDDDGVIAMDDSEDDEGPIGFVGVSSSTYSARRPSNDINASHAVCGLRSWQTSTTRILASSNSINQVSTGWDRSAPRNRCSKRMNEGGRRKFELDPFPAADRSRRRRVEITVGSPPQQLPNAYYPETWLPSVASRTQSHRGVPTAAQGRSHHSSARGRGYTPRESARESFASTYISSERPISSSRRVQTSFAFHGGHSHTVRATFSTTPAPPSWRSLPLQNYFQYDYRTDEFETLPPEPEPVPEDLRSIASLSRGTPAPEHIVSQLPVIAVSEDELVGHANNDDVSCAICMDDYCRGDHRKLLPCLHSFHNVCLDQWLAINGSCPICKHRIQ
jgi:Ring finger domain